jgi:hypothetical protein
MESRGYEFSDTFRELYEADVNVISSTGHFDIAAMEKLIADAVKTGNIEKEIDWREFVRMDYLNQAYKELGLDDKVVNYS